MARNITNKAIVDGINKVAENYFKASNAKGLSESTRNHLTAKWAFFREMAVLLSQKQSKSLESMVFESQGWLVGVQQVEKECAK
jgi:hypothetical protein